VIEICHYEPKLNFPDNLLYKIPIIIRI